MPRNGRLDRRALAAATATLLILAACEAPLGIGSYRIATHGGGPSMLARLQGVLHGKANQDGTACLWVGEGHDRQALIWPDGFVAQGDPLKVYDGSGRQIGMVGQQIVVGGGLAPDGTTAAGCTNIPESWLVGTVVDSSQ